MQRVMMVVALAGACTFTGIRLSERLKNRAAALRDLREGIQTLTSAITHTRRPLGQIAAEISRRGASSFWSMFAERLSAGEDAGDAWSGALEAATARGGPLAALMPRDRALLISFSVTLGKTNRQSQAENGQMTLEALSALIESADEVYAQKGRVYRVLGLFLGLGLGILLW